MRILYHAKGHQAQAVLRAYSPAEWISRQGLAEARVLDARYTHQQSMKLWAEADLVVFQWPFTDSHLGYIRAARDDGTPKVVVDIDDNPWAVHPLNEMGYRGFGTKECGVKDDDTGKLVMMWEDGKNGFDLERNARHQLNIINSLKLCNAHMSPTRRLADTLSKRSGHSVGSWVWPNCLDPTVWGGPQIRRKDDILRLGWHGGISHYEDWLVARDAVTDVLKKNPKVHLVIYGTHFEGITKDIPEDQLELHEWTDIHSFPHVMRCLSIDIGLCPLERSPFTVCKSPLKWIEYSMLGIPVVASEVPPYEGTIAPGVTGVLAGSEEKWVEALETLIGDKARRKAIGHRAFDEVHARFDVRERVAELVKMFKELIA